MALGLSLFPAARGDRSPCPAKPEAGRKTVFGLRDCAWRVRDTDPRRTIGKLGQTRRTRQAVAANPESNTKACVRLLTVGTAGTTQVGTREVSDRTNRFGKSPLSQFPQPHVTKPQSIPNKLLAEPEIALRPRSGEICPARIFGLFRAASFPRSWAHRPSARDSRLSIKRLVVTARSSAMQSPIFLRAFCGQARSRTPLLCMSCAVHVLAPSGHALRALARTA